MYIDKIIIGSPDPSFTPIELIIKIESVNLFKEYYDVNDEALYVSMYNYALTVLKRRWPEAEPIIMKKPKYAHYYAISIIGRRWPEAEPYTMQDAKWAYRYARDVIGGRWPEAEPIIMQNAKYAYFYACFVIGGRWPEAEPIIMKDEVWASPYLTHMSNITTKYIENLITQLKERGYHSDLIYIKNHFKFYYFGALIVVGVCFDDTLPNGSGIYWTFNNNVKFVEHSHPNPIDVILNDLSKVWRNL